MAVSDICILRILIFIKICKLFSNFEYYIVKIIIADVSILLVILCETSSKSAVLSYSALCIQIIENKHLFYDF